MVGIRSCILFYLLINAALVAATGSGISIGAALASSAAIAPHLVLSQSVRVGRLALRGVLHGAEGLARIRALRALRSSSHQDVHAAGVRKGSGCPGLPRTAKRVFKRPVTWDTIADRYNDHGCQA